MALYAVGDIQGCYASLIALLSKVDFNPSQDHLWVAGDMVNRGPESLKTLQYLHGLQSSVTCVLGNHDLHLLAVSTRPEHIKKTDTFGDILNAQDIGPMLTWLRHQKLLHYDAPRDTLLVHAGIPPIWGVRKALKRAEEVQLVLRDEQQFQAYTKDMYGNEPNTWQSNLRGMERLRLITNYFTRMRFCTAAGMLELKVKENETHAPAGYSPWFAWPDRKTRNQRIVFGHWAALEGKTQKPNVIALDTGCVWGGGLTLLKVDTGELIRQPCPSPRPKLS